MQKNGPAENERDTGAVLEFLKWGGSHVYMIGIGGIGMAGLANLLCREGLRVSGSDCAENAQTCWLREQGVEVYIGHAAEQVGTDVRWCVRSTAVPETNCEMQVCRERGIPVFMRGAALAAFMQSRRGIAVSGTHGKTSTSAMIRHVLLHAGIDAGWFVGGETDEVAVSGNGGEIFVSEVDESDGTVALYQPETAVITNVEFDHMEHFESREHVEECFARLIGQTRCAVVFCADDAAATRLCAGRASSVSYGFSDSADVQGVVIVHETDRLEVVIRESGEDVGTFTLALHGEHNALNALGAYAAVQSYGVAFEQFAGAMERYRPVKRRFERCGVFRGAQIVSDYAHHPTEIRAVIRMASAMKPHRLLCVFQPHRYTRTLALREEYMTAFDGVDHLVLCPVYAASEQPVPGGTTTDLFQALEKRGHDYRLDNAETLRDAWALVECELGEGDVLLIVGAGNVDSLARQSAIEHTA